MNEEVQDVTHDELFSATDILDKVDEEFRVVDVPEWGEGKKLRFKVMSSEEAIAFSESIQGPARKTANIRIIIQCAVDANGKRIFTDRDIPALKKKSVVVTSRLAKICSEMNSIAEDDKDGEKTKNG